MNNSGNRSQDGRTHGPDVHVQTRLDASGAEVVTQAVLSLVDSPFVQRYGDRLGEALEDPALSKGTAVTGVRALCDGTGYPSRSLPVDLKQWR